MRYFRPALSLVAVMTLSLGVIYPLLVTGAAKLIFPHQASGSLLHEGTALVGSEPTMARRREGPISVR